MAAFLRNTCMKVTFLSVFLLFFQGLHAQVDLSGLDPFLQRNQKALGNNYVALVWKDGKLLYQKQAGEEFTAKTQAPVAATSMWLTSALVMTFVDEGKISLDDPVSKYIPTLDKYMKSYITIRNCLTHTHGVEKDKGVVSKLNDRKKFQNLEEEVAGIAAKEISNNPGEAFFFSGNGPVLAARVCEIVGKKSFDRLIQDRITRPLKMKGTSFVDDRGYAPNPASGAVSTANDLINFMNMLLNKGVFENKKILSEKAVQELQQSQFTELPVKFMPAAGSGLDYGLGAWLLEKTENGQGIVVSSPSLFGTWPILDNCRKYAAVLFVKSVSNETKRDLGEQFRGIIEEALGECK